MARDGKMDVHLDVPSVGYAGRLEVIEGPTGRRRRSDAEKARIVAESLLPGVRVADVARRHAVTHWQVYDWRRLVRSGRLALPENVADAPAFAALVVEQPPQPVSAKATGIEIVVGDVVIRAGRDADEFHLSRVSGAARRPHRRVLPTPDSLTIKGAALTRTLAALLKRGLLAEARAGAEDPLWRSTDDGERLTLVVTDAGLRALGIEDTADGAGDADRAAAEEAVRASNQDVDPTPGETTAEASETTEERPAAPAPFRPGTKGAAIVALLARPEGASLAEMMAATGWQAHSVRGFLSGTPCFRLSVPVTSELKDCVRRYRIERTEG